MNQKIRIAACDDDATVLSALPNTLNTVFKGRAEVDCFGSEKQLLDQMKTVAYDIIILDINMPDVNGLTLGKRIRSINPTVEIVYLSNYEDKVFDTFIVSPMAFVRKSAFFTDISRLSSIYAKRHEPLSEGKKLAVRNKDSIFLLEYEKIRYIENFRNVQYVYADGAAEPYMVRMTIRRLLETLCGVSRHFVQISSGVIVNLAYVRRLNSDSLVLEHGEELSVSRRNREAVKKSFFEFLEDQ